MRPHNPESELKGTAFVEDLLSRQIFADFFIGDRGQNGIPTDLIPAYRDRLTTEEEFFEEWDRELVGLDGVKNEFRTIYRAKVALGRQDVSAYHRVFTGSPGTGKTTVARILANDLARLGVLPTNKCIVAERKDLISFKRRTKP